LVYINKGFSPKTNENFIDCTLGSGGHAEAILERTDPAGKLLGIDLDEEAIQFCREKLTKFKQRIILVQDNFVNLKQIVNEVGFSSAGGILFDLGVSLHQLTSPARGFSFKINGSLDMRFGRGIGLGAREVVNEFSEDELAGIFRKFGEIRQSKILARNIVLRREKNKIVSTKQLSEVILKSVPGKYKNTRNRLLARAFQALRIAVNDELKNLREALWSAASVLGSGGRLAVISYHSLEDRIVKNFLIREAKNCICPSDFLECRCDHKASLKILTKKPVVPTKEEIIRNPRSRSAKLRAAEKL
jgi:16S rRNA (cytosine1402-N4)-methyltransferase